MEIPVPGDDILGLGEPEDIELKELRDRYLQLAHAIQTGVKYMMEYDPKTADAKHLRTGLDCRACDHAALVRILLDKKVITEKEYYKALCAQLSIEVEAYQERIANKIHEKTGQRPNITLG